MNFEIRPYHPSDLSALYRICLLTGDSGKDASGIYLDPDLLGHFYAAPYAVLEPELCFILTHNGDPSGYVLGTSDSIAFFQRCETDWFPPLRERYPPPASEVDSPDSGIIRLIHEGHKPNDDLATYPANLHIDILPIGQGQGCGRELIVRFRDKLRQMAIPAVHLEVGKANTAAIGFYERVGFHCVREYETTLAFGMRLT